MFKTELKVIANTKTTKIIALLLLIPSLALTISILSFGNQKESINAILDSLESIETELNMHINGVKDEIQSAKNMVEYMRLELMTSSMPLKRSSQLS